MFHYLKKAIIWVLVVVIWFSSIESHGYFEYKFHCQIWGTTIGITLNDGELCFDYLARLNTKINAVQQDIQNAEFLISQWQDASFWSWVLAWLKGEESILLDQQSVVIASMQSFEASLFTQIKTLLQKPINAEKKLRLDRINIMRETMESTKKQWLTDSYQLIVTKMEAMQYELFVMDRMLFSADFEEMVPFIKEYLSWRAN